MKKNVMVFVELNDGRVADVSLELICEAGRLAQRLGVEVEGVAVGHGAREELAELIKYLHIEDLPEETTHAVAFRRFTHQPQKWKIWGAYLTTGD